MEKSCRISGELMVNGHRFTHHDFLTGLAGKSGKDVLSQMKSSVRDWLTKDFIESHVLEVRLTDLRKPFGKSRMVALSL